MPNFTFNQSTIKITEQERQLVDMVGNLSDAQVYLPLTEAQIAALPGADLLCQPRPHFDMSREKASFLDAFATFHGGISMPEQDEMLFGYSASLAIEILANALRLAGMRHVGLLHPTYDATFHILTRHGADLTPVPETELMGGQTQLETLLAPLDALMLTLPNNPTGWAPDGMRLLQIARAAARTQTCLIIDACFRAYDPQNIDTYAILRSVGCDAVVIEDTGKLFSIKDIKLGAFWVQGGLGASMREVHRDFLLDVPLFSLITLRRLLHIDGQGHLARLRATVARNRRVAVTALTSPGLRAIGEPNSNVQLFRLPSDLPRAELVQAQANDAGVGVVAANAYFWAEPRQAQYIRLALARHADEFDRQIRLLQQVLERARIARTVDG